jgi:holo-[acyl-carrier protein] synthase
MTLLGMGIDIVEFGRIKSHLARPDEDWLDGVFTEDEQRESDAAPNDVQYYAGRYAAKEAVAKAIGTGFGDNVAWLDIEVLRLSNGAPMVRLSGQAAAAATALRVERWLISISHSGEYAVASAIAIGN